MSKQKGPEIRSQAPFDILLLYARGLFDRWRTNLQIGLLRLTLSRFGRFPVISPIVKADEILSKLAIRVSRLYVKLLANILCHHFTVKEVDHAVGVVGVMRRVSHHHNGSSFII
jgi:hypothetical protein